MIIPFIDEQFCSSSRHIWKKLRSLHQVNDETFSKYNAEIGQNCHLGGVL